MTASRRRLGLPIVIALLASACSGSGSAPASSASPHASAPRIVYAAVSASDGVGLGATDPRRDAWPQVFFRTVLPESAVMYNLSEPGLTVDGALAVEAPEALSVSPTLVTVWLNLNDVIAEVTVADYERQLGVLVHDLRRGGQATVLVANTPYLDRLPAYLGCRTGAPPAGVNCPPGLAAVAPAELDARVDAYNAAISRVVRSEGAVLVDLHAAGETPDLHPDWVSSDGFHPSSAGYAAIAATFAATWRQVSSAQS
jgi:acyl-CoA thioesterase-1